MSRELFRVHRSTDPEGAHIIELLLPDLLDVLEFDRLNESLLTVLTADPGRCWVFDLAAVAYMGSAVLGLMVNLRQHVKDTGGRLVLCALRPRLQTIFHSCSLNRLFVIVPTRQDALISMARA